MCECATLGQENGMNFLNSYSADAAEDLSKLTRACGSACPPSSDEEWATPSRDLHGIVLKLTVTPPNEREHPA